MKTTLVINPELKDLLPPLSPRQFAKLESEIRKDGCTSPLIVWGNVIVDGHHRHTICTKHGIPFQKVEKTFESMDDAKLWMWQNQNSRRNLSRFQRAETALKMKEIVASQAKERQGNRNDLKKRNIPQNSAECKDTRQILAEFAEVSHDTLDRVEFLLKHADVETLNRLRWDKKETSINKEFTRIKAEVDAQKPKKEKKSRTKTTSTSNQAQAEGDSNQTQTATTETKTKETKKTAAKSDSSQERETASEQAGTEQNNANTDGAPETIVATFKSSRKIEDKYCCGTTFEPDPDDDYFDWITEEERAELNAMRASGCPNRIVPPIHNFMIQNIPEHSPEPLITCLYSLFKVGYRKKLAYGLLRRIFSDDDKELAKTIVSELHDEFQNQ